MMDCKEAREVYIIPIGEVRRDKLHEASIHIDNCKECQNYYRLKYKNTETI